MRIKRRSPGARHYLRRYGLEFLDDLERRSAEGVRLKGLAGALKNILEAELSSPEKCLAFWAGIKPAMAGCPQPKHFDNYENILAYAFVHLLDRYLRVWEILRYLTRAGVLPIPRRLAVLDVGSGPAPALYAISDFYQELRAYGELRGAERLVSEGPELQPIELSQGMRHFFHGLSEVSGRQAPFGVLLEDFSDFNPPKLRERELRRVTSYWDPEGYVDEPINGEMRDWARNLHRYQLVFFSNFLTEPALVKRFRNQVDAAFREQRPGGVIVIMGGVEDPYPSIYNELDEMAEIVGHKKVPGIPPVMDDASRRVHFQAIKDFNNDIWNHLEKVCQGFTLERKDYPPYWDSSKPIKNLKPFAVRVYRKGHAPRQVVETPNTLAKPSASNRRGSIGKRRRVGWQR